MYRLYNQLLLYANVCCSALTLEWFHIAHDEWLWRRHAVQAQYIRPSDTLPMALQRYRTDPAYGSITGYWDDVRTFSELVHKRRRLDECLGRLATQPEDEQRVVELHPQCQYFRPAGWEEDVWRIKLDPVDHCVIVTGCHGGIRTLDAHSGDVLWSLPRSETREHPHLEWSEGWMIFDRLGTCPTTNLRPWPL